MPNFDGGHYFLTTLIPISTNVLVERDGQRFSPIQMVRKSLAMLPTALQTPASVQMGLNSPFSRGKRTHFARFVVIEDAAYNGRDPEDAIKIALKGINPVLPQPQDTLCCPFLLFVADFDAASGDKSELASYLTELWATMEPELREVFGYCVDFQSVTNGAGFADYIQRGQIETTMPFNDYWTGAPPLKSLETKLFMIVLGFAIIGAIVGFRVGGIGVALIGLIIGAVPGLISAYSLVMQKGAQPFPTAPNTDLPSILKALYLQQKFTQLAIDVQGLDDAALHAKFAAFLNTHQPLNLSTPTQLPGVIN